MPYYYVGSAPTDALNAYTTEAPTISSSTALAAAKINPADSPTNGKVRAVLVTASHSTDPIYLSFNGDAATTSMHRVSAGESIMIYGYNNVAGLRIIRGTSGTAFVTFFR